jgi:hypothetical protein
MTHTWRPLGNYSIYPDSSMTDVTWIMVDEIINTLALHGDLDADVMVDGEEWHCIACLQPGWRRRQLHSLWTRVIPSMD